MTNELEVAETVRAWSHHLLPDQPQVINGAVERALRRHAAGASISEACEDGFRFVGAWAYLGTADQLHQGSHHRPTSMTSAA
jgi:hypothetical protein